MKRGKLSEKDRIFIITAKQQNADPAQIAKQLDRSVDLVQKIMGEVQPLVQEEKTQESEEEEREESEEMKNLRAENEFYKQMTGKKPKGVVVMTPGASQRVDDIRKVTPGEYFNDEFMARHPNRKTSN